MNGKKLDDSVSIKLDGEALLSAFASVRLDKLGPRVCADVTELFDFVRDISCLACAVAVSWRDAQLVCVDVSIDPGRLQSWERRQLGKLRSKKGVPFLSVFTASSRFRRVLSLCHTQTG